jgi:hypothetical protein
MGSAAPARASGPHGGGLVACLLFCSLCLFAIRVRGEPAPVGVVLENLLLVWAMLLSLNAQRLKWFLLVALGLSLHRALTLPLVWRGGSDLAIAVEMVAIVLKCIGFAFAAQACSARQLMLGALCSASVMLAVFLGRLMLGLHIDPDNSFAGGMADRNYMALMVMLTLFSAVLLIKPLLETGQASRAHVVWLTVLHVLAFLLILRSGSRSGLLCFVVSFWIFSPRLSLAALPFALAVAFGTDLASFLTKRLGRLDTQSQEEFVRLAQIIAAWSRFEEAPLGLLTGFGVMASHHLEWFERGFALSGLDEYFTVVHNSLVDFLLAFGVIGVWLGWRMLRPLPWSSLFFLLASTSFINVLAFLPFYLLLAVFAKHAQTSRTVPAAQPAAGVAGAPA